MSEVRNVIEAILTRMKDIHQVEEGIVQLADDSFDLEKTEARCLIAAVDDFNNDKPRRRVKQVDSVSGYLYSLPGLISDWSDQHVIQKIQIDLDGQDERWADLNDWIQTINPATELPALRFRRNTPSTAFAIWYLCPHTFNMETQECSITRQYEEAVAQKGAAKVLEIVANKTSVFTEKGETGFPNDSVDYGDIHNRYRTAADRANAEYDRLIGKNQPEFSPSFVDLDNDSPLGRRPFHPSSLY